MYNQLFSEVRPYCILLQHLLGLKDGPVQGNSAVHGVHEERALPIISGDYHLFEFAVEAIGVVRILKTSRCPHADGPTGEVLDVAFQPPAVYGAEAGDYRRLPPRPPPEDRLMPPPPAGRPPPLGRGAGLARWKFWTRVSPRWRAAKSRFNWPKSGLGRVAGRAGAWPGRGAAAPGLAH